jgi:hypothetical protein
MIEHLPWIIAGLVVGLFVGYAFGKFRGATEVSEELGLEDEPGEAKTQKAGGLPSQTDDESGRTVFIRRGGSHYHKEACRHLRRHGGQPISKSEALKKGFRRCPSCRP